LVKDIIEGAGGSEQIAGLEGNDRFKG